MSYKDGTSIDSYNYAASPATPQVNPDNTFATDALDGSVVRFSTTGAPANLYFSTAATPLIPRGSLYFNSSTGVLRLNIGTSETPVWRSLTNS